ncbi:MAG: H4MPT-linked C1 transfer pathway protein [Hyphomicrobiales bacterium]|nr:H4MPT-linked C1 transfer pathway protein [Hyphomicrobiales bacterium]
MASIIGWDIGGAHLKAARVEDGVIVAAVQIACPLWEGLLRLDSAFAEALGFLGQADAHAAAMTGELCDAFATRAEGVAQLAAVAAARLSPAPLTIYSLDGFVAPEAAPARWMRVASANWLAPAALAARMQTHGLFADMGSTTTDLIPFALGTPRPRGETDAGRLACGELVYTGMVRSLPFAGVALAPFGGRWTGLMADLFANMADVHRILGQLPEGADAHPTWDGRDKSLAASQARLARLVGAEARDCAPGALAELAAFLAAAQRRAIEDAARLVFSAAAQERAGPLVAAGVGRSVLARVAAALDRPCVDFATLAPALPQAAAAAADNAPAAAIAILRAETV